MLHTPSATPLKWLAAAVLVAAVPVALAARTKVTVHFDKKFDFKPVRTWAWNPAGPGDIKMARTAQDDPEAARKLAEPIILESVGEELGKRGLTASPAGPDVTVTYYLLLSTSQNAQTMGQFMSATPEWGLPPFPPATQSLKVMYRGSLVLDVSAAQEIVWRGVAQADIDIGADPKKREAALREGIRDLLRRFPPR
jgi:hypothetical protein